MPIEVLTVFQFLSAFVLYLLVVMWLPSLVLGRRIGYMSLSLRLLFYFTLGNFYIINIVYLLQLLKISNWLTLWAATLLPVLKIWKSDRSISFRLVFERLYHLLLLVFSGRYGLRLMVRRIWKWITGQIKLRAGKVFKLMRSKPIDSLFMIALVVLIGYFYGRNLVLELGYSFSDISVHTQWVNSMDYLWPWEVDYSQGSLKQILSSWNDIFSKGVYPFGLHNILYYLHVMFNIDTFVLFRVFWLAQDYIIFLMPVVVLKALCRTKYAAYLGALLFLIMSLSNLTYYRYYGTLPQESGMMFILPTGYFLIAFFLQRKKEIIEGVDAPKKKLLSTKLLAGFTMSLSMTLTVHFYDTFAVAFLCLGIGMAFFFRVFRKGYFGRIVAAGLLSLLIGMLPLLLGLAMGKGAQGSIGWGLSVIMGTDYEGEGDGALDGLGNGLGDGLTEGSDFENIEEGTDSTEQGSEIADGKAPSASPFKKIITRGINFYRNVQNYLFNLVFVQGRFMPLVAVFIPVLILLLAGLIFFIRKNADYGGLLWSGALHQLLLMLLLLLGYLHLPELMDRSRASIYFAYGMTLMWGLTIDCVVSLLFGGRSRNRLASIVTIGCIGGIIVLVVRGGMVRSVYNPTSVLQINSSVVCLTNILHDRKDNTWTICSANDVIRQVHGHGYHYEAITFLQDLMYGRTAPQPTPWMYFFVEKVPIDYTLSYPGSGQRISLEGAQMPLPPNSGITQYMGENRWIIMSKLYYWGMEFMERFPNQMRIYYETDDFICFEVRQNEARLFNFVIPFP